ncbi:MAG: hypothetical protein M3083_14875 [Actinomycetota bacterium]|nr:hypothetical protein [Actinomycetota bacterium]
MTNGARRPKLRPAAAAVALLVVTAALPVAIPAASAEPSPPTTTAFLQKPVRLGTFNLRQRSLAAKAASPDATTTAKRPEFSPVPGLLARREPALLPPGPAPQPAARVVTVVNPGSFGFSGLTQADQRLANNGHQFTSEPPDQGLCANNGVVMETVNNALDVFTDTGFVLVAPTALSQFFGLPDEVAQDPNTEAPIFGPFLSDPRCYYDAGVQRWFVTELRIDTDSASGFPSGPSTVMLAVSQTNDPTASYTVFSIDATDDGSSGTPRHTGCPCFPDQPLIGADANGFYVSASEFPLPGAPGTTQHNAQVFAMSKQGLADAATGAPLPTVAHLDAGRVLAKVSESLQPATTPTGGTFAPNREYFLSTPDISAPSGDRLVIWALAGTRSLAAATPSLSLSHALVDTELYVPPPTARQERGPRPLGQLIGEPLGRLQSNDNRMQQVVYAQGRLFAALGTGVGTTQDGLAWFVVTPSFAPHVVTGTVAAQGYLSVANANLLYPAVAVNAAGNGIISFGLTGPANYPSAAYANIASTGVHGRVHLSGPGTAPDDGFTCYQTTVGAQAKQGCRWGDYSAAVAEDTTNIVAANEYIPNEARTTSANWGTFITRVTASAKPSAPTG